jgi:hypothetical protein
MDGGPVQTSAHTNALIGVMSDVASPAARTLSSSPNATDGAMCRHEAGGGGHWVLTAGLVRYFYGVTTGPVASSRSD